MLICARSMEASPRNMWINSFFLKYLTLLFFVFAADDLLDTLAGVEVIAGVAVVSLIGVSHVDHFADRTQVGDAGLEGPDPAATQIGKPPLVVHLHLEIVGTHLAL